MWIRRQRCTWNENGVEETQVTLAYTGPLISTFLMDKNSQLLLTWAYPDNYQIIKFIYSGGKKNM